MRYVTAPVHTGNDTNMHATVPVSGGHENISAGIRKSFLTVKLRSCVGLSMLQNKKCHICQTAAAGGRVGGEGGGRGGEEEGG